MKITVITVSYNAEKTIEKTIKSVINQKDEIMEYIIIDGGSTDNTMNIIRKYQEKIDTVVSEKDHGIWNALNKGIRLAGGDYIIMVAGDDILLPNAIASLKRTIKLDTQVWCGTIITHCEYGYEFMKSDPDLKKLYRSCSLRHPATFFKKELFDRFGYYDETLQCSGDRELFLRFYVNKVKFQIEDIPIVLFQNGGLSSSDPTRAAIPEDRKISLQYGLNVNTVEKHYHEDLIKYKPNRIKRIFKWLIFKLYLYDILCILMKKENKRVPKKILKEYGITGQ